MVRVPAGGFQMGRDVVMGESLDAVVESPRHVADAADFYVDVHEVTNAQFERFVAETGHVTDAEQAGVSSVWLRVAGQPSYEWVEKSGAWWKAPEGPGSSLARRGRHPVVHVSYRDAAAYAKWARKRLPTEAEWEKAARGVDGRPWPWGFEAEPARLNCKERGIMATVDVGSFPGGVSPFAAVDLAGNVREWTDSWLLRYPGNNGTAASVYGQQYRVVRGGGFHQSLADARVFRREWRLPKHHESVTGFRCVADSLPVDEPK
jgi:sulfatase modifying factor 1